MEENVLIDFNASYILEILDFALNITKRSIINQDYLFIKLQDNIENPLAVLHRGKKNYELLFENELRILQKMEIKNPTREMITGYIPIRTLFLHGEFIGKKLGDKDILFLYEGFYLTIDSVGNSILYKKEYLKESEFTTSAISLGNIEEYLIWLDDKANEKYKSLLEEEKQMRKKN